MADPKNRSEVIALGATATGVVPDVLSEIYKLYYEPYSGALPKHGEINVAGVSKTIELLRDSGELKDPVPKADRFIDLQFLQAAGLE
jgi:hypothetical protein